ncbi:MAG TPA: zinc ribbon domain-containing protein [Miltoncostaeaceae bacterium]|nr:zinc ribbon domain-containing protein [Miltoncostaeaceae bacterium]
MLDGLLHPARARVAGRGGRRAFAERDEDAVTLGATAAAMLLDRHDGVRPGVLVLATTTPPYRHGGSVQPLAEMLVLDDDVVVVELTATPADGLTALRVAGALAAADRPAVVVAAHRGAAEGAEDGDGAVALLVGPGAAAVEVALGPASVREGRERWALAGGPEREGDPTLTAALVEERARRAAGDEPAGVVSQAGTRPTGRVERALGGPGDPVARDAGFLGAAHAPARLLAGAAAAQTLVVTANGITQTAHATPGPGAADLAAAAAGALAGGADVEGPPAAPVQDEGFAPYQSLPRAERERGQELRLAAVVCAGCGRLIYPPPVAACPSCGAAGPHAPARLGREGTVLTMTRDHVYPDAAVTTMAVVAIEGGGRFYGQAIPSAEVAVGDRVRLVPRVLHRGGDVVQYFWKVEPCR